MKIKSVELNNFRQYKGKVDVDLSTTEDKNIILIGGLNGYGKTNFLVSLVWCLYGQKIEKTDGQFKKQIQKAGNYPKFLKENFNKLAKQEGLNEYSVSIIFENLTSLPGASQDGAGCVITRTVKVDELDEDFKIEIKDSSLEKNFTEDEEKINFVNDFLIPLDAAKFIFFNAEKISAMADLSVREEGELMNDALGNILGLDIYEDLVEDLSKYIDSLLKESSTGDLKERIESSELEEKIRSQRLTELESDIAKLESQIQEENLKINQYDEFLQEHSIQQSSGNSLQTLYSRKKDIQSKLNQLKEDFNSIIELVPFAIASPLMEETLEQIKKQNRFLNQSSDDNEEFIDKFVEGLFNQPEFPPSDEDLSFKGKVFYTEKAKDVLSRLIDNKNDEVTEEPDFFHDLKNSDEELLEDTFSLLRVGVSQKFEDTVNGLIELNNDLIELNNKIKNAESNIESEEVIEYKDKRKTSIDLINKYNQKIGRKQSEIQKTNDEIKGIKSNRQVLLTKSKLSAKRKKEIEIAKAYVKVLNEFIVNEKEKKSKDLSSSIFSELKGLLHKLGSNNDAFIKDVVVKPLPENDGLNISIIDKDDKVLDKDQLSEGEKQLYISALIKSLLKEAIQDFPIIIDTPLGRLDQAHINNILANYYPNLANQVVLMATDSEIPVRRKKLIDHKISRSYLLEAEHNSTKIKQGYFTT